MGEKITERFVRAITAKFDSEKSVVVPPGRSNRIFYDAGEDALPGFGLRVTARGAKSFILNYRHRGRERRMTIGQWPTWTALKARIRAAELRRLIDSGVDPLQAKEERRAAPRMGDLLDRYMAEHAEVHKKPRSVADDRYLIHGSHKGTTRRFQGLVGQHFANMHVDEIEAEDVRKFHLGLKDTPTRGNRALALLSKVFSLAEQWSYRPQNTNPCKGVKKYTEKARDRHLNGDELARLGRALASGTEDARAIAAVRLLLFTGMRVGELLGLRWSEIDIKYGVARLSDAKAGSRDVQLPAPALAVIAGLSLSDPKAAVIGLPYDRLHSAWQRICKAAELENARLHDCRHTMGTYAGAAGFNAFLVKQLLGHKTLAMTDRYVGKHVNPLREASQRIAQQLAAAMKGDSAEVVELREKAGEA
jgi:integrase